MSRKLFLATAVIVAVILTAAKVTVFGQGAPQQYVPIILDAPKFDAFIARLRRVSMPADAFQELMFIIQDMETVAQREKAQADAAVPMPRPAPEQPK